MYITIKLMRIRSNTDQQRFKQKEKYDWSGGRMYLANVSILTLLLRVLECGQSISVRHLRSVIDAESDDEVGDLTKLGNRDRRE